VTIRSMNAGTKGVSGALVFSSGTSSSGNTGAIYIGTGAATGGRGGAITIAVGTGASGAGGDLILAAGGSSAAVGGSVYIKPGVSTTTTSGVYLSDGAGTVRITLTSATVQVDSGGSVDVDASTDVTVDAGGSITLTGATGLSFGTSILSGFETGSGQVASSALTLSKMTGKITSPSAAFLDGSSTETFTLTNARILATTSIVIATVLSPCSGGRVMVTQSAVSTAGSVSITVYNAGTNACTTTYVLGFLVLNS